MIRPLALSVLLATSAHAEMFVVTSEQDIYTMNTATAELKFVGGLSTTRNSVISLAVNPVDGSLSAVARVSGRLLTLNRRDASVSDWRKLNVPSGLSTSAIAYDSRGVLYGVDGLNDKLGIYGTIGSGVRNVGNVRFAEVNGLAFDADDTLYAIIRYEINGRRYLIKLTKTGKKLFIGELPHSIWLGLAFDDRGVLYTTERIDGKSSLYEVDPETASLKFVADVGLEGDSVVRLAFGRLTACHVELARTRNHLRHAYDFIMNWLMSR